MNFSKCELFFSKERLARFVSACKGDFEKGLTLYRFNLQASQALHPVISIVEVALRNSIDRELAQHFGDINWLLTRRADFADHPGLVFKNRVGKIQPDLFFRNRIMKAEKKLACMRCSVNHVKLLTELTFGFWIKFFDANTIKILKGIPLKIFSNKPGINLTRLHSHLNSIVTLRNRIAHNEPICFDRSGKLCLGTMQQYQLDIEAVLYWLDCELGLWVEKLNFYKPVVLRIGMLVNP